MSKLYRFGCHVCGQPGKLIREDRTSYSHGQTGPTRKDGVFVCPEHGEYSWRFN